MPDRRKSVPSRNRAAKPAPGTSEASELIYEGNPKHKEPWQIGRKGSMCPKAISPRKAQEMLVASHTHGAQRYAVHDDRLFAAKRHGTGKWHGHPIGWHEAPPVVRHHFETFAGIKRSVMAKSW